MTFFSQGDIYRAIVLQVPICSRGQTLEFPLSVSLCIMNSKVDTWIHKVDAWRGSAMRK